MNLNNNPDIGPVRSYLIERVLDILGMLLPRDKTFEMTWTFDEHQSPMIEILTLDKKSD